MIKFIDNFLNRITMYRLILYYLIILVVLGFLLSVVHAITFSPVALAATALFLVFFGGFVNDLFAGIFQAPTNVESVYISSLILALVINPAKSVGDFVYLAIIIVVMVASKYILAIGRKHIFNPVAIALVISAYFLNQSPSWWVGNAYMTPFVVAGGLLIVRKVQKEDMVYGFFAVAAGVIAVFSFASGTILMTTFDRILFHSSFFFLAFVMLTEPLTTPPTKLLQIVYGGLTGLLFVPQMHIGSIYSTPELALVLGNIFSFIVSPKNKLIVRLQERMQISSDTYDFIFPIEKKFAYLPGQYMEWTLSHNRPDSRGNRRYFTLASSPTEDNVRIGVKFYNNPSSFKKNLLDLSRNNIITASQLSGEFTLSKNPHEKYVFIAGGIGITPFRSILKYLIDTNKKQDIVVMYSNKNKSEIAYQDVLKEAEDKLGIRTTYTLTDPDSVPANWKGYKGRITSAIIEKEIPDYRNRKFYLSGPHALVNGFEEVLKEMGVNANRIKKDFFPGFA